jgi:hypothetical protein
MTPIIHSCISGSDKYENKKQHFNILVFRNHSYFSAIIPSVAKTHFFSAGKPGTAGKT